MLSLSSWTTVVKSPFHIFLLLSTLAPSVTALQYGCVKEVFGSPNPADCSQLLDSLADSTDDAPRLFDEEQLRIDARWNFPGVKNQFATEVVQIPAFWSLSKCKFSSFGCYVGGSLDVDIAMQ